jgi:hypothetical protein
LQAGRTKGQIAHPKFGKKPVLDLGFGHNEPGRHDAAIERQNPINPALVPPAKHTGNVRYTLTAPPTLPQFGFLTRRKPYPSRPFHALTS